MKSVLSTLSPILPFDKGIFFFQHVLLLSWKTATGQKQSARQSCWHLSLVMGLYSSWSARGQSTLFIGIILNCIMAAASSKSQLCGWKSGLQPLYFLSSSINEYCSGHRQILWLFVPLNVQ
uniref:Uncharacterized protein n=1 Tax=Setaria italica TaxID=4555 RepID=K3YAX1_SETIT